LPSQDSILKRHFQDLFHLHAPCVRHLPICFFSFCGDGRSARPPVDCLVRSPMTFSKTSRALLCPFSSPFFSTFLRRRQMDPQLIHTTQITDDLLLPVLLWIALFLSLLFVSEWVSSVFSCQFSFLDYWQSSSQSGSPLLSITRIS